MIRALRLLGSDCSLVEIVHEELNRIAMTNSGQPDGSSAPEPADSRGGVHQELQHNSVSARIPEKVGPGVFASAAIVMHGAHEFVIDFLQGLAPPQRIAARVVLSPSVVPLLLGAMQENLKKYQEHFGPVPRLPQPPQPNQPTPISDLYESLKIPDDQLSGVYANTALIVHNPAEFCIDFITSFYPRSAVAQRVYLSAPHVPELFNSLQRSWEQFRQRAAQQGQSGGLPPGSHQSIVSPSMESPPGGPRWPQPNGPESGSTDPNGTGPTGSGPQGSGPQGSGGGPGNSGPGNSGTGGSGADPVDPNAPGDNPPTV